jgi:hypothetical protein
MLLILIIAYLLSPCSAGMKPLTLMRQAHVVLEGKLDTPTVCFSDAMAPVSVVSEF